MRPLRLLPALSLLLLLSACGGSSGGSSDNANANIQSVGWHFENLPSDYDTGGDGRSLGLNVNIYYTGSARREDIQEAQIRVELPDGTTKTWPWTIPADTETERFGSNGNGLFHYGARLFFEDDGHTFPLKGTWTAKLKLKDDTTVSQGFSLHEPGEKTKATHKFLYTEDGSPPADDADYVPALKRFPVEGVTVSLVDRGAEGLALVSSGLKDARASFIPENSLFYNSLVWLYDAGGNYLGRSLPEFKYTNHERSGWMPAADEMSLDAASTEWSGGITDIRQVKSVRFVYTDGEQYTTDHAQFDIRSVSPLVPVE